MKRDLASVVIPFPKGLMSTARSALSMPVTLGREVRNMLMSADGAGSKRNGVITVGNVIAGEVITACMSFQATTSMQLLVATDAGKIYRLNGASWVQVYTGLNGAGVVRTVTFGGKLLLCNGVNDVMAWDGSSWTVVSKLVVDAALGLTYVSGTQFTINSDASLYAVGTVVRAKLGSSYVTATVTAVSVAGAVVTVTLGTSVLTSALNEVAFTVKPPKFASLVAVHDRLWGFGKGVLTPTMSGDVDRLRVYYTYGVNDYTAWPDPATGSVPSINLADKAGVADELMAMSMKDGMTVFVGRNHLQLWSGTNPGVSGDLAWAKTIPLGIVHGNAMLELPNDLLFVTRQGARTLSRTLQTEQLDVSDIGSELDPTITELVAKVMANPALYKRVTSFRHDGQGWFGLAMEACTLVWQVGAFGHGWVLFDGVFAGVTAAHAAPDGELYIAKAGQVYKYETTVWNDAGAPITVRWWMPWVNPANKKRWANKYIEVLVRRAVDVAFQIRRYCDYDDANPQVMALVTPTDATYWDETQWETGLWDSGNNSLPVVRDHVVADSISFAVESETVNGPFTIFGLKLYGVAER